MPYLQVASSVDLKQSSDFAATISSMVHGENYMCLYRVSEEGVVHPVQSVFC